jgi:hypothetical protein
LVVIATLKPKSVRRLMIILSIWYVFSVANSLRFYFVAMNKATEYMRLGEVKFAETQLEFAHIIIRYLFVFSAFFVLFLGILYIYYKTRKPAPLPSPPKG